METKFAEGVAADAGAVEPQDDPEYTPQPSGKRRKVAETHDTLPANMAYVVRFGSIHVLVAVGNVSLARPSRRNFLLVCSLPPGQSFRRVFSPNGKTIFCLSSFGRQL